MTEQRRIRRRAGLPSIESPSMITLTKSPANRSGFKIMRADNAEEITRSDDDLLAIELPAGSVEADADGVLAQFALGDDYEKEQVGTNWRLRRKGSDSSETGVHIPIGNGLAAMVRTTAFLRGDEKSEGKIIADDCKFQKTAYPSLTTLRFDTKVFPAIKDVQAWLQRNDIDHESGAVKVSPETITVSRNRLTGAGTEVDVAEGVKGVVVRADKQDVPVKIYRSVLEQAYGNYGWGHVDFAAALVDPEFTDRSWDALWALRDVLENIIFYSRLPLDDRKVLIRNACSSYADYMESLIGILPRAIIEQQRSDKSNQQENAEMAGTQQKQDDKGAAATTADTQFVTRSELASAVAEGVAAALAKNATATAKEPAVTDTAATEQAAATDPAAAAGDQAAVIQRSDSGMTEVTTALTEVAKALKEQTQRTDELVKTLAKRSDETDANSEAIVVTRNDDDAVGEQQQGQAGSVFSGLFDPK